MRASRPSSTARVIAAATVLSSLERGERALVPASAAAWCSRLLSTSVSDRMLLASVRTAPGRAAWRALERLTLPGIFRHYAVRKAFIEEEWRTACTGGFGQLLVLGAGLDTLGLRVASSAPVVRVVELDHPATQAIKRRVLAEPGTPPLQLVEGQLNRAGWSQALVAPGILEERATLAVLEGVSMYLREPEMARLLCELGELPVPRLRLVFTLFERQPGGPVGFHPPSILLSGWLRLVGEPFRWACAGTALGAFLQAHGFALTRRATEQDLHQRAPGAAADGPVLRGETVAVADRVR